MPTLILFAFALPFLLWPIESLIGKNGYVIEEFFKLVLLLTAVKSLNSIKERYIYAFLLGFAFFFTETVFYLFNIFPGANTLSVYMRMAFTLPMHIATSLVMVFILGKNPKLLRIVFTVLTATTIHLLFNFFVKQSGI